MAERYGLAWSQLLLEPLGSLRQLGRRAGLAVLGIVVGCGAVVALLNIGQSAATQAMRVFEGMGSDLMVASLVPETKGARVQAPLRLDIADLIQSLPAVRHAAPLALGSSEARFRGRGHGVMVVGSSPELKAVLDLQVLQGRLLSSFDAHRTFVWLGASMAVQLAGSGAPVKVGEQVQLGGYLFEVAGVLAPRGHNPLIPVSLDDALILPIEAMRLLPGAPQIGTVLARSTDGEASVQGAEYLRDYLLARAAGRSVDVQIPQQLLEGMARQSKLFSWLMAGLGGISLLVGGVGVMNVMLMNVAERRREIGVRMALGARPWDIALLFLLEAMLLSVVGALLGAVLGVGAAWGFALFSGWAFSLSLLSIGLGVGSSLMVGLFFGLHPALSAARLQPVLALRDD